MSVYTQVTKNLKRATLSFDSRNRVSKDWKKNEYLQWIRFAVPGMLAAGNIDQMDHAIWAMPAGKSILEIGSFCGRSGIVLSYLLDRYSPASKMFTSDKWEFEGQQLGALLGDSHAVTHDAYKAYVKDTFVRGMEVFSPNRLPHTIECFSDDFFQRWHAGESHTDVFGRRVTLGGEIGFCYIDGNHTYDFAKRDFENTNLSLVSGGFVLFDDSADGSDFGVNRLCREIVSDDRYELISRKPNYLFRKK